MKKFVRTGNALERFKKLIPPGVQPKFGSVDEWRAWQAEEGRKRCEELEKQNQRARAEKIFGRAGIQDLHRGCTFAN
ncbi:DNA replication protein DnaC, partial [Klebsiella pneumoniae]